MGQRVLKPQLVKMIAEQAGLTHAQTSSFIEASYVVYRDLLLEGFDIQMPNIGTMSGTVVVKATKPREMPQFDGTRKMCNGVPIHFKLRMKFAKPLIDELKIKTLDKVNIETGELI